MILSSGEAAIYEAASGIAVASLTDVNLCAQSERSEVFRFIFSELQQALPYLPNEHSANAGVYEGRITQPVINFLLAKLAFNAEIYTFDDWTRGYKKRPKGKKSTLWFRRPMVLLCSMVERLVRIAARN